MHTVSIACSNNSLARSSFAFPYLFTNLERYVTHMSFTCGYLNILTPLSYTLNASSKYLCSCVNKTNKCVKLSVPEAVGKKIEKLIFY